MSIRKRLFLSNAAMVITPIVILILSFILFSFVFKDEFQMFGGNYHHGPQTIQTTKDPAIYTQIIKTASLNPEKLSDPTYLHRLSAPLKAQHAGLIIRKGDKVLYHTKAFSNLGVIINGLPAFGNEGYSTTHIARDMLTIRQHDFYFNDGAQGTLFFIGNNTGFAHFASTFFPLIFLSALIILILTNVLLSYFVSRSILKPVNQLTDAANKISEGHLDFQIASKNKDELGRLVNTFDQMRASLKELMDLRDQYENNRRELVANISHDLKTPLTSIRGYVEGIQDGVANTEDKRKQYLDTIQTKVKYMDHLIDELFLYSKLDVKGFPFYFDAVDIKAFMEDYIDEIRFEHRDQNVEIMLHTPNGFGAMAWLDRDNIIRVMNNIVYNSIKYSDKGLCHIDIHLKERDEMVEIKIGDNGPGVAADDLDHIFNRFYRVDPARNTRTGGSGLGLAIASQIIEAHGGTIRAESEPNKGLAIYFTLKKSEEKGGEK